MTQLVPERRSQRSPQRWETGLDVERPGERLRRLLEQTFSDVGWTEIAREAWIPDVDIEEQDDAYMIEAELPGIDRKDVNVELVGNELLISGEMKEKERKGLLRRQTRRVGRFEVRVALPDPVDTEGISAELERGVLTVRVPKAEASRRRRIEIKS